MSEIFNLAKELENKSQKLSRDTETLLASEFHRHVRSLKQELNGSKETINNDIHAMTLELQEMIESMRSQNVRVRLTALQSWGWIILTLIIVFSTIQGLLWYQVSQLSQNRTEIEMQRATLAELDKKTFGIQLIEGEKGRFIQIPQGWTVDTGWTVGEQSAIKLQEH